LLLESPAVVLELRVGWSSGIGRILAEAASAQFPWGCSSGPKLAGESNALLRTIECGRQAAASEADVLIEAESGTGKEVLARMIHHQSGRRTRPFVAVNCSAVPEALLESELFGHAKGAYTGANTAQTGQIESAQGGTLLLDEIGEMPLHLQPKLLRGFARTGAAAAGRKPERPREIFV